MKRTGFFLSIALSISLVGIIAESYRVWSCGPGVDYEKYRISYVDPDLLQDSLYQSFYRTLLRPHQDIDNYNEEEFRGSAYFDGYNEGNIGDRNLAAWDRYFEGAISARLLSDLIYLSDSTSLATLRDAVASERRIMFSDSITPAEGEWDEPDTIHRAEAFRVVAERRDLPFVDYLEYAIRADDHAWEVTADAWDDSPEQKDTAAMERLIEEGITRYRQSSSSELKIRYGFQVLRLARYLGRYDDVATYYRTMISPADPTHPVRMMALGHVAGARLRSGDTVGSIELFAHRFDSLESDRIEALRDIKLGSERVWREVYARASTPHQKANLQLIRGLKEQRLSFDYVREIYRLTPRSPKLELALFRELHRIESYLYDDMVTRDLKMQRSGRTTGWEYDPESGEYVEVTTNVVQDQSERRDHHMVPGGGWDSIFYYRVDDDAEDPEKRRRIDTILSGREYVASFRRFVLEVAREGKVPEPALWYMVAGYIDIMDGDLEVADQCLEEAREKVAGNYDLRRQIRLLEYLRQRMQGKDPGSAEEEIADALAWMAEQQRQNRHSKFDRTMAELGRRYLVEDDVPRAVLAFGRAGDLETRNVLLDMYANDADLKGLEDLLAENSHDPLDRMLIDSFPLSPYHLIDIRATRMMRRGEYRKGRDLYNSIPIGYWGPTGDPGETACFRFTTNRVVVDTNLPGSIPQGTDATELRVTRREFANELTAALDRVESTSGQQKTAALVSVADLLYNAPYWGYNSVVWDGSLLWRYRFFYFGPSAYPLNIPGVAERMEQAQETFLREYGSRAAARAWYARAVDHNADRELAARAAYMLDLCDKQPATSLHDRPTIAEQSREGYDLLMRRYRDTRAGREILSRCSVYRYF